MKIGLYVADQHPEKDRSIGISRYTVDLANELDKISDFEVTEINSKSSLRIPADRSCSIPFNTNRITNRIVADNFHPLFLRNLNLDLLHYPKGYLPLCKSTGYPSITTIHDTIIGHYHKHYRSSRSTCAWIYWLHQLKSAIQSSDAILTISENARQQILGFADDHRISTPKIFVTYEGSRLEKLIGEPMPHIGKPRNYVLALSSAAPHKQIARLVSLWTIWANGRKNPPELLLVGKLPPGIDLSKFPSANIRTIPHQKEADLIKLIREASGVVVPSEIEGFGLPILEAFYLGTPAIVVNETSCHELLDFHPTAGFQLNDQESFNQSMLWLLNCEEDEIIKISQRLRDRFSWSIVAEATVTAYQSILDS